MVRFPTTAQPRPCPVLAALMPSVTVAAGIAVWACGRKGGGGSPAPAATGAARSGQLLVARDQSLHQRAMKTSREQKPLSAPAGEIATYPSWTPDGSTILLLGTGGLYQPAPDGSAVKRIDLGSVHGQIAWLQR